LYAAIGKVYEKMCVSGINAYNRVAEMQRFIYSAVKKIKGVYGWPKKEIYIQMTAKNAFPLL